MSNSTKEIYARLFTQSPTTQNLRAALLLQHPLEKQPKDILKTQSLIQFKNIRGKKNIKDASAVQYSGRKQKKLNLQERLNTMGWAYLNIKGETLKRRKLTSRRRRDDRRCWKEKRINMDSARTRTSEKGKGVDC